MHIRIDTTIYMNCFAVRYLLEELPEDKKVQL